MLYVNLNTQYALQTNTTSLIRLSSLMLAIKLTMIILTQELALAVVTTLTLEVGNPSDKVWKYCLRIIYHYRFFFNSCKISARVSYVLIAKYAT